MPDLFGAQPITRQQMLGCARRELAMRERVYPRWVQTGRMTQDESEREIATMAAIVRHFEGEGG